MYITIVFNMVLTRFSPVSLQDFYCSLPWNQSRDVTPPWEFLLIKCEIHFAFLHLHSGFYYYDYVVTGVLRPFRLIWNFLLNFGRSYPEWLHRQGGCLACCGCTFESRWGALIYTVHVALRGYCPWGWGVRSVNWIYRLWHNCPELVVVDATRSSLLGCFSTLLQVVDNWTHILWK